MWGGGGLGRRSLVRTAPAAVVDLRNRRVYSGRQLRHQGEGRPQILGMMRGVLRRLFTAASAISLLLCMVMLVLLAFRPWKHAVWEHGRYFLMVRVAPGGSSSSAGMNIRVGWPYENEGDGDEPRPSGPRHISVGDWSGGSHELLSIHCAKYGTVTTTWLTPHRYRKEGAAVWSVSWYYLPASGFLAVLPVAWALVNRKRFCRRRPLAGSCDHCGYDLRASTGRCPECGRAIPAKVSV